MELEDQQLAVQLSMRTMWMVKPDLGEFDEDLVTREADVANGKKVSGWSNPLGWTDDGNDDDLVVTQLGADIRYDESEGPTKADNGEADPSVVHREADVANGAKVSGWTNPLGWTDSGDDDDSVLLNLQD